VAIQETWSFFTWFGRCSVHYRYTRMVF